MTMKKTKARNLHYAFESFPACGVALTSSTRLTGDKRRVTCDRCKVTSKFRSHVKR